MGYELDGWGSIPGRVKNFFLYFTLFGRTPAQFPRGGKVKRSGREADNSPPSRSRILERQLLSPIRLLGLVAN
jgi:hypothetical protein